MMEHRTASFAGPNPDASEGVEASPAVRYATMLIAKAGSQDVPDTGMLDRIEKLLSAQQGTSVASRLTSSYVEMLIEQADSQDNPAPELLDRIERLLDGQPTSPSADTSVPARRSHSAGKPSPANGRRKQGDGHPEVNPSAYRGMGTTAAYRSFVAQHGRDYSPPQIRNALIAGGLEKTPSALLTAIHGIKRRDRIKAERLKGDKQSRPSAELESQASDDDSSEPVFSDSLPESETDHLDRLSQQSGAADEAADDVPGDATVRKRAFQGWRRLGRREPGAAADGK